MFFICTINCIFYVLMIVLLDVFLNSRRFSFFNLIEFKWNFYFLLRATEMDRYGIKLFLPFVFFDYVKEWKLGLNDLLIYWKFSSSIWDDLESDIDSLSAQKSENSWFMTNFAFFMNFYFWWGPLKRNFLTKLSLNREKVRILITRQFLP